MNKAKFHLFVLMVVSGLSSQVLAQESGFPMTEGENSTETPQYEEEWSVREGGILLPESNNAETATEKKAENDLQNFPTKVAAPGTTKSIYPPVQGTTNKESSGNSVKSDEKDESVLSFNFLYYLIQKFKFETVE